VVRPLCRRLVTAVALLVVGLLAAAPVARPVPAQPRPIRLVLVGDSTVTDENGWGFGFAQWLGTQAECINASANGRSSKSFIDEGRWSAALALKGDYYLIQFGHNDEPGKGPERETDPGTTYAANMTRFVNDVRSMGARPILITSLTRRRFTADGRIEPNLDPYDLFFDNINQLGFSVGSPVLTTLDNGLTFAGANLTNPIPSGGLTQPVGAALGLGSSLGLNLTGNAAGGGGQQTSNNLAEPHRQAPFYTRWEISVQHDFGSGWVAGATYVGSRGRNLPTFCDVNNIPIQYLSTSRFRDTANETLLATNVAKPFAGLLADSTINGATVQRQQLLRPFPEFGTFGIEEYGGSDTYNAGTLQLERRFRNGNSFSVQYTRSRVRDKLKFLNPADGVLEDRVSPNDRPNRLAIGSSMLLPFGRGRHWGNEWNRPVDAILGGWQFSGTYQYQSGFPLTWNATYYDASCGDPSSLVWSIGKTVNGKIMGLDVPAWDTSCFYFHDAAVQTNGVDNPATQRSDPRIQLANNVRYFPSTLPDVRTHQLHLMDLGLFKNFSLPRRMTMQFRMEIINALNYTVL
jgi:hypothetical protein